MKEVMIYFHYTFEDKQRKNILYIFLSCKSTRQDDSFPFVYAKFLPSERQSRKLPLQTSCHLCSCVCAVRTSFAGSATKTRRQESCCPPASAPAAWLRCTGAAWNSGSPPPTAATASSAITSLCWSACQSL